VAQASGGARYGGQLGPDTYYRIYGTYQRNDDFRLADGSSANDRWDLGKGGFRVDHYPGNGGISRGRETATRAIWRSHRRLVRLQYAGRWTRSVSERSGYEVQAFWDHAVRNDFFAETSGTPPT